MPHAGISEVQASYTYAGYRPPQSQTQPANLVPAAVQRPVQHSIQDNININKVCTKQSFIAVLHNFQIVLIIPMFHFR